MDELKKYLQENRTALDQDEPRPQVWEAIRAAAPRAEASPLSVASAPADPIPAKAAARVVPVRKILSWAAAACVLALAGIGAWNLYTPSAKEALAQAMNPSPLPPTPSSNPSTQSAKKAPVNSPANATTSPAIVKTPTPSTNQEVRTAKTIPLKHAANAPSATPLTAFAKAPASKGSIQSAPASDYMGQLENGFSAMLAAQKNRVNTTPMYAESAAYFRDFKVELDNLEKDEKQLKKEIQQKGLRDDQLDALINIYQQKLTILKQLQLEMNKTNNRYKQQRGPIDTSRSYFISI